MGERTRSNGRQMFRSCGLSAVQQQLESLERVEDQWRREDYTKAIDTWRSRPPSESFGNEQGE